MLNLEPMVVLPEINPNAELTLRKAEIEDVQKIYDLIKYWADKGRMLVRSHELLYATLGEYMLLVTPEKEIAGCVGLHRMAEDLAEVRGLAIHPSFVLDRTAPAGPVRKGKGLGKRLVAGAETEGKQIGLKRLFAWTYEQIFFEKCGFHRIPREEATLPSEVHAECQRCPFQTNCQEIPMLKMI